MHAKYESYLWFSHNFLLIITKKIEPKMYKNKSNLDIERYLVFSQLRNETKFLSREINLRIDRMTILLGYYIRFIIRSADSDIKTRKLFYISHDINNVGI